MNDVPAVILNIQRQPGANIIAVVDRVKALLPQLRGSLPASVQMAILTDRTTTIRASVADVEFELMLTIALVVMVIFLFLRTVAATVIPSVAVPLSLVGHVRRDVSARLQPQQPHADGVDDFDRLRRRRRDRDDRKHHALHRGGRRTARGRAEGLGADRLHDPVADRVAHRRADSAAVHGRHRRTAVPGIRRHAQRDDSGLGGRLADVDADDVRQAAAAQGRVAAGPVLPRLRARLPVRDRCLRPHAAMGAAASDRDARCRDGDARVDDPALRRHSQGILSRAGHGRHHGRVRGGADGLVPGHGRAAAGAGEGHPARPGRRESVVVHRHRRHEYDDEHAAASRSI